MFVCLFLIKKKIIYFTVSPNSLHHSENIICAETPFCISFSCHFIYYCIKLWRCVVCVSVWCFFQNTKYSIVPYSWFDGFRLESDKMHLLEQVSNYTESCNVSLEPLYSSLLKEQLTLKAFCLQAILFPYYIFFNIYLLLFFTTRNIFMKTRSLFFRSPSATTAYSQPEVIIQCLWHHPNI